MNETSVAARNEYDDDTRASAMLHVALAFVLALAFGVLDGIKLQVGTASKRMGPVVYLASSAVSCGTLRWMRFELTIAQDEPQRRNLQFEPRDSFAFHTC